jgi:hypothetical protein
MPWIKLGNTPRVKEGQIGFGKVLDKLHMKKIELYLIIIFFIIILWGIQWMFHGFAI